MTLKPGWYLINDNELFLFATNGFWDREEKMQTYRNVKARYHAPLEPRIESLRSEQEQHHCGDNCNGECSGEVDGIPKCKEYP